MDSINHQLFLYLNFEGGAFLDQFFWIVSGKLTWVPLYIYILYAIYKKFGWKSALLSLAIMGLGIGITDQVSNFFKDNMSILRPTRNPLFDGLVHTVNGYLGGTYGTVSAHAATTCSVAVFSLMLLRNRWYGFGIIFWTFLVGYSRIYLGVHFPQDVLFGYILGFLVAVAMYALYTKTMSKIDKHNNR